MIRGLMIRLVKMTGAMGDYVIGCPDWHPALNYPA